MNKRIVFLAFIIISTVSFGQRIKIDKKKLQFLKDETKVGVMLTFPKSLTFMSDQWSEAKFVETEKKKLSVHGHDRVTKWFSAYEKAKNETWRDDFLAVINERLKKYSDIEFIASNDEVNYIIIIEANWMYPGYGGKANVGRQEGKLKTTLKFVKATDVSASIYSTAATAIGDYTYGEFGDIARIGACYKRLGFLLELQLRRILK